MEQNIQKFDSRMDKIKKRILAVDDDESVLFTLKHGLEKLDENFEVICVKSGKECFELLQNIKIPDIILLDIMMPDMNGWEVGNRLRENLEWNKIPIVFLTAKNDTFSKTFGKTVTMDFNEKPFVIEDLKDRINKIIGIANQRYPVIE